MTLLLVTLPVYRRRDWSRVTYLGKAATFALFWSLPLILAGNAGVVGPRVWRSSAKHVSTGASVSMSGVGASMSGRHAEPLWLFRS